MKFIHSAIPWLTLSGDIKNYKHLETTATQPQSRRPHKITEKSSPLLLVHMYTGKAFFASLSIHLSDKQAELASETLNGQDCFKACGLLE